MNIPNLPNISSLFKQKISEIQSRLPIKMNVSSSMSTDFAQELNKASASSEVASALAEPAAPVIDIEPSAVRVLKPNILGFRFL